MIGRFLTTLDAELLPDGRWRLRRNLVYESARHGRIVVPEGFVTDFASVPRVPAVYWLTGNAAHQAAVVHDWLYRRQTVSRRTADAVLLEASACSLPREPRWRRVVMWAGVRLFGWIAWRANRL